MGARDRALRRARGRRRWTDFGEPPSVIDIRKAPTTGDGFITDEPGGTCEGTCPYLVTRRLTDCECGGVQAEIDRIRAARFAGGRHG